MHMSVIRENQVRKFSLALLAASALAAPVAAPVAAKPAAPAKKLSNVQRMQIVIAALDEMRPYLKADGGDVELIDIDGKNIYVRLSGACSGCQMASVTIEGIQSKLVEKLGELVRVIPHTMMAAE